MRPTASDPVYRRTRAVEAARVRWSTPEHTAARAERLADHIRRVVGSAPPLTAEQIERLRALLPSAVAA